MSQSLVRTLFAIFLLALCVALEACKEKHIPTGASSGSHTDGTYIGSWNWIKSIGGFAGTTTTPATEGYTMRIELTRDSMYTVYRDGVQAQSGRFSIHREKNLFSPDSVDVISYSFPPEVRSQNIRLIGRDTLNLIDQCMDCYSNYYVRARY